MSHLKEREEKVCLNCNTELNGRYCHVCGQENLEPKESFWHLTTHFVYDVTHFDGKFFSTLKYLLFKPGFLPLEYSRGKRQSYLHPIRMYVFASAIFFIIFLGFVVKPEELGEDMVKGENHAFDATKNALRDSILNAKDSAKRAEFSQAYNAINNISGEVEQNDDHSVLQHTNQPPANAGTHKPGTIGQKTDTPAKSVIVKNNNNTKGQKVRNKNNDDDLHVTIMGEKLPATKTEYDSLQSKLPENKRDGWLSRTVKHRFIDINIKFHGNQEEFLKKFIESFLHSIPKIMFISVPFVALVLALLYVRRRKQFYYVNHVIFIIYVYIATFISLLVYFGLDALYEATHFEPFSWLSILVLIYIFLYSYLAMRNFYKQGYFKTFFKYFLLLFICTFLNVLLVMIFGLTSLLQI